MADSLLDRAIYSYVDVDRLVGLRAGTARRWLEGYERQGRYYDPVLRPEPTGSDAVTWGEMVESRLLAKLRDRKVPVQRMRPAIVKLRGVRSLPTCARSTVPRRRGSRAGPGGAA